MSRGDAGVGTPVTPEMVLGECSLVEPLSVRLIHRRLSTTNPDLKYESVFRQIGELAKQGRVATVPKQGKEEIRYVLVERKPQEPGDVNVSTNKIADPGSDPGEEGGQNQSAETKSIETPPATTLPVPTDTSKDGPVIPPVEPVATITELVVPPPPQPPSVRRLKFGSELFWELFEAQHYLKKSDRKNLSNITHEDAVRWRPIVLKMAERVKAEREQAFLDKVEQTGTRVYEAKFDGMITTRFQELELSLKAKIDALHKKTRFSWFWGILHVALVLLCVLISLVIIWGVGSWMAQGSKATPSVETQTSDEDEWIQKRLKKYGQSQHKGTKE